MVFGLTGLNASVRPSQTETLNTLHLGLELGLENDDSRNLGPLLPGDQLRINNEGRRLVY